MTNPELRSAAGLLRICFEVGATEQYYPLLHSWFGVQQKLWGDATLGDHLAGVLLLTPPVWDKAARATVRDTRRTSNRAHGRLIARPGLPVPKSRVGRATAGRLPAARA